MPAGSATTRRRSNGAQVQGAEVWRGPASSSTLQQELFREVTTQDGGPVLNDRRAGFSLCFMIPAAGSGGTKVRLWVGPEGFADLAEAMMQADPVAAVAALRAVEHQDKVEDASTGSA